MTGRRAGLALIIAVALVLGGCSSAKERAARHLQSALALVQKGDIARASVEFRNVFKLDPQNRDGHIAFGNALRDRGNLPEAYAQYRAVIDADPTDIEALQAGAEVAADLSAWADANRNAEAALAIKPDVPAMLAVRAGFDYATAVNAGDAKAREDAAARAAALVPTLPKMLLLRRIVIDSFTQRGDLAGALKATDDALAVLPQEELLYRLRVSVLAQQKDDNAVAAELAKMVTLFPDDPGIGQTLLRWYIGKKRLDDAEAFLRGRIAKGGLQAEIALVGFLQQFRSADAALTEIDQMLATMPAATQGADQGGATPAVTVQMVQALRAGILFDQGHHDEAVKALQDILAKAEPSDQTRQIRVTLARMMAATGDLVQARAQVEQVLAEDSGQAEALKLKASWLIADDKPEDAVALLRQVVDADAHDAAAMTMMAQAYDRMGSHDLVGDMLAQAVGASGNAAPETLRYVDYLLSEQKYQPAEALLVNALRLDDSNVGLLAALGRVYVLMKDWGRATAVVDRLDGLDDPAAKKAAQDLRPAILAGQKDIGAAIGYLQDLAGQADAAMSGSDQGAAKADLAAKVVLLRAYLGNGQIDQAKALTQAMLAAAPKDPQIRLIAAAIQAASGDPAGAEAVYRDLLKEDPKRPEVWGVLIRQLIQQGRRPEAEAATDAGLAAVPDARDLQLFKANFLEQKGDIDGAIAIYEKLYAARSDDPVVANDLASLLSSWHDDAASLDRAWAVARRLNGTQVPAFADTYGWILARRGQADAAVPYLQSAAQGLPQDPVVQFHLAETYRALNRMDEARTQYAKVLTLVPKDDSRFFAVTARAVIAGQKAPSQIPGLN